MKRRLEKTVRPLPERISADLRKKFFRKPKLVFARPPRFFHTEQGRLYCVEAFKYPWKPPSRLVFVRQINQKTRRSTPVLSAKLVSYPNFNEINIASVRKAKKFERFERDADGTIKKQVLLLRRRYFFRMVLEEAITFAKEKFADKITLETFSEKLKKYYEEFGFTFSPKAGIFFGELKIG